MSLIAMELFTRHRRMRPISGQPLETFLERCWTPGYANRICVRMKNWTGLPLTTTSARQITETADDPATSRYRRAPKRPQARVG